MTGYKRHKKRHNVLAAVVLVFLLVLAYFHLNPDQWYLLTSGSGKTPISMKKALGVMQEVSLEEVMSDEKFSFDQSMLLINIEYLLPEDFVAETEEYKDSGVAMNRCILEAYGDLSAAVLQETEDKLYISSGIRDRNRQAELYAQDPETATLPGASEHETGLCLDVYVEYYSGDGFLKSKAGQFVNSNCQNYGFIIRYPNYGEKMTGIRFEPWHIRYVGHPHADIIYHNGLTLEEYVLSLKEGVCYEAAGYLITRQRPVEGMVYVPTGCESYIVSPDNTGCYIITGKK